MARTKQTARKSTGGCAPRKKLGGSVLHEHLTIKDHTSNKVYLASRSSHHDNELSFFPFQVYLLSSAKYLIDDETFPRRLANYISSNNSTVRFNENCQWHLQIYTQSQESIFDCINHHEHEKAYRKSQGRGPIMLNRKEFLVIDSVEWETKGIIAVDYTAQMLGRDGSERDLENHVKDRSSHWPDDEEEVALPGLREDLHADRHDTNSLAERVLEFIWYDEGHEWQMPGLIERNVAMGWPSDPYLLELNGLGNAPSREKITRGYLPTETRPRGEDECDVDEDDEITSNFDFEDHRTYGERCDPETAIPKSILQADKPTNHPKHGNIPFADVANILVEETVDNQGVDCTTATYHRQPVPDKSFSFSLYITGEDSLILPTTLFSLLNRGMLAHVAWCLHVYALPSINDAITHFIQEMAGREADRRRPMSYAGGLKQPKSHIFICLNRSVSPRMITSNSVIPNFGPEFEIFDTGNWVNAAQILFTYHLLCSETPIIVEPLPSHPRPTITAALSMRNECLCENSWDLCPIPDGPHLTIEFTLNSTAPHPVTINSLQTILNDNPYWWKRHIRWIDTDTGNKVQFPDYSDKTPRYHNAESLQAYSFSDTPESCINRQLVTLHPGKSIVRAVRFMHDSVFYTYGDSLDEGKTYKLRLDPEIAVERWVWGEIGALKGPFGLEPIHVVYDGHDLEVVHSQSNIRSAPRSGIF